MLRRYSFYEHVFGRAVNIKIVGGGFISPRAESYPASAADAHIPGASLTRSPINYNVPHHHGEKLVFRFAMQLTRSICSEKKKHDVVTKPKVKCSRRTIICLELYKKNIWHDLSQYSLSLQNKIVTFVKDIICLAKPCLDT